MSFSGTQILNLPAHADVVPRMARSTPCAAVSRFLPETRFGSREQKGGVQTPTNQNNIQACPCMAPSRITTVGTWIMSVVIRTARTLRDLDHFGECPKGIGS